MNLDVVNTALQALDPVLEETFCKAHPLFDKLTQGGSKVSKNKLEGRYKEFAVITGDPGQITAIHQGDETISSGLEANSVKGNEYATRMLYHYEIPIKNIADADGKMDLVGILDHYPKMATLGFFNAMAAQLARGAATSGSLAAKYRDAKGFMTLNGDQTYAPEGVGGTAGTRQGFFQYADPDSQTALVHGLASQGAVSNAVPGWFNHYKHVNGFDNDGLRALREMHIRASQEGTDFGSGVDLMFCDILTYLNFVDRLEQFVQRAEIKGDVATSGANRNGREGLVYSTSCVLYNEPEIKLEDTTSFTSAAPRTGLIYGISSNDWEMFSKGSDANKETNGLFATREGFRIPDKEAYRFEVVFHAQMFSRARRSQFCVTGTAVQ